MDIPKLHYIWSRHCEHLKGMNSAKQSSRVARRLDCFGFASQ
jgi:hypothetical protein